MGSHDQTVKKTMTSANDGSRKQGTISILREQLDKQVKDRIEKPQK